MKKELAKILIKRLEDDNFKHHFRLCEQSSRYGRVSKEGVFVPDTDLIQEKWNNEEFINWLLDVEDKETSEGTEEVNRLLKR